MTRRINIADIDHKEVIKVNIELTKERLAKETDPRWQSMLRKQIRGLQAKLTFDAFRFMQDNPSILN